METKEIWKPVVGWEGLYEVSSFGRVRSKFRYVKNRSSIRPVRQKIIASQIGKNGYLSVGLSNGITKRKYVHRLVCEAFIPNTEKLPQVNHKDGNRLNNYLWNLEWCTQKDNLNEPQRIEKIRQNALDCRNKGNSKPVMQFDMSGRLIAEYPSLHEAERATGILQDRISQACRKKASHITCSGYIWKFDCDNLTQKELESIRKYSVNPVLQYDMEMNFIAEYRSSRQAAIKIGCNANGINLCCRRLQKTCMGFIWRRKYELKK